MAEEKAKLCPLAYAVGKGAYDQEVASFDSCVKEQCAWWIKDYEECVVSRIARELTGINSQRDTDIYERKRGK